MLAIVDLNTDSLYDALESLQTVLLPWLESRPPSLSEADAEREYVKMALQVIDQYDPELDEAKRTYYVYQLVAVLNQLAQSPNLQNMVSALRAESSQHQSQTNLVVETSEPYQRAFAEAVAKALGSSAANVYLDNQLVEAIAASIALFSETTSYVRAGRLPDLPKGQPLRERPQARYDVSPQPSER